MVVCLKHQEGAVSGQKIPRLLQASQFQTVGLLQLNGEAHEETQHTPEASFTQQEVRMAQKEVGLSLGTHPLTLTAAAGDQGMNACTAI